MKTISVSVLAAILAATPVLAAETAKTSAPAPTAAATAPVSATKPAQKAEPQKVATVAAKLRARRHRHAPSTKKVTAPKGDAQGTAATPAK